MSHLLAISVGPVQEFIAAARRTRDLWFGSYLLSEISRAVAKAVEVPGEETNLIFPASSKAENVANVILAELPSGEPKTIAAKAKQAAEDCWKEYAVQARKDVGNAIQDEIWNSQINDVIEFYTAWVTRTDNYKQDRTRVMRLLAGRKSCRDFPAQQYKDVGIPKSSLDGQRPSVLIQPERPSQRDQLRESWPKLLRLSRGEELDIVGITKRLGKESGENAPRYASVERIAADPWLREKREHRRFEEFKSACRAIPGLNRVGEECFRDFPIEGTVVYKNRYPDLEEELGPDAGPQLKKAAALLQELGGEPNPYLAVLVADGDRMGAAISRLESPNAHREFSTALAGFADKARTIVNEHYGVLVYAGGDDVLAFLPVDQCLCCARKLREDFRTRLDKDKYGHPTLSVGIAIGHFMENLEDLLEYGRAAEKAAKKPDRDGLAVHLHKRGGAPIQVRANWSDDPDKRLKRFADLINDRTIPGKLPYELRQMVTLYENGENWPDIDAAIQKDLFRLIAKKTSRGEQTVREKLSGDIAEMNSKKLLKLAEELLVARMIAEAAKQAGGEE
jgi:CRISPR-associated protein Cmr2